MKKGTTKNNSDLPTVMVPATGEKPEQTKVDCLRAWFEKKDGLQKWSDCKKEVEEFLLSLGHTFNEKGDYQQFRIIGKDLGKVAGRETQKSKSYNFSDYCKAVAGSGIDSATLSIAIEIVASCESLETAEGYSQKWAKMVELFNGDIAKAQEAIAVMG